MVKINKKNNNKNQGFTLIEVALVLVLVGGAFLGIYGIFGKTIANDDESFHEVTASNLAQEGVELMRNQRDVDFLNGDSFGDGVSSDASFYGICIKPTSGFYGECDIFFTKATPYERQCSVYYTPTGINTGDNEDAIAVSCVVKWTGIAGIERKARAMAILTNWQEL